MTTRICETCRRPSLITEAHPARGSLLDMLTAIRHHDDAASSASSTNGAAQADRRRFPRWTMRDRRVQRLRGWLSGAPG